MKIPVVLWKNGWKEQDLASDDQEKRARAHKQPDLYLERDAAPGQPKTGQGAAQGSLPGMNHGKAPARPAATPPRSPQQASERPNPDDFEDDIPF